MNNSFVKTPNLPQGRASLCAIGEGHPQIEKALASLAIEALVLKCSAQLVKQVSSHADMLILHTGENRVIISDGQEDAKNHLESLGFAVEYEPVIPGNTYPDDVILNAAILDGFAVGCKSTLDFLCGISQNIRNKTRINVRQGYTKCSVCPISKNAVITDDKPIGDALSNNGFDVLYIDRGEVILPGYPYGFIGGACGLISYDTLAICGDLRYNTHGEDISAFLRNHGVYSESLISGALLDIGGILPLMTYEEDTQNGDE